jgi:hypothetical protein
VSASSGALEAVERILGRSNDADDVLRDVVAVLHSDYSWVGISFVEEGELVLGPALGEQTVAPTRVPISYENNVVAELGVIADEIDRALLERVAVLIAPYCLVGWDTGGEAWSP